MKERPILMSALMDGRKTQTRRAIKPQPLDGDSLEIGMWTRTAIDRDGVEYPGKEGWGASSEYECLPCPYGMPGDRLYVKEATWLWCERRPNGKTKTGRDKWHYVPTQDAPIVYVANGHDPSIIKSVFVSSPDTGNQWGWRYKVARFMPRWASRITLEVTEVRVQRLQEISERDAMDEGAGVVMEDAWDGDPDQYRKCFRELWGSINGAGSWALNPWVWVVSFKVVPEATK